MLIKPAKNLITKFYLNFLITIIQTTLNFSQRCHQTTIRIFLQLLRAAKLQEAIKPSSVKK